MIKAKTVKFIKLGRSGGWEKRCIVSNKPMIRLGFNNPHHQKCLDGDWDFINRYWLDSKTKKKGDRNHKPNKKFLYATFYNHVGHFFQTQALLVLC